MKRVRRPGKGISGKDKGRATGLPAKERISVSALKGIDILSEGDVYDLACWLLKINDGKDKGSNSKSRHTVHGLAGIYSMAASMSRDEIASVLQDHGLPLGATIEYDEDAA